MSLGQRPFNVACLDGSHGYAHARARAVLHEPSSGYWKLWLAIGILSGICLWLLKQLYLSSQSQCQAICWCRCCYVVVIALL